MKRDRESRPWNVIQIDRNLLEARLERFDAEADEIAEAVRYERSGGWGLPRRPLRPEPDRQGQQPRLEGVRI